MKLQTRVRDNAIWLKVMRFIALLSPIVLSAKSPDNDFWSLLNAGRYISANTLYPANEPFTIWDIPGFTFQQWLTDLYMWKLYSIAGGTLLIYAAVMLQSILMNILMYRVLKIVTNGNEEITVTVTFLFSIMVGEYMVTRPEISSLIVVLTVLWGLLNYQRGMGIKWLILLPAASVAEINLHGALWLIPAAVIVLFAVFRDGHGYRRAPVIAALGAYAICGLLNPYSYRAVIYPFFHTHQEKASSIIELQMPGLLRYILLLTVFVLPVVIGLAKGRRGGVKNFIIAAVSLVAYTMMQRSIVYAALGLSLLLADVFRNDTYSDKSRGIIEFRNTVTVLLAALLFVQASFSVSNAMDYYGEEQKAQRGVIAYLDETVEDKGSVVIQTAFNNGAFIEFAGYTCTMDGRMEIFGKHYDDDINFEEGLLYYRTYIGEIDADYIVLRKDTIPEVSVSHDPDFECLYGNENYRIYTKH